jgi:hypothetical protein
VRTTTRDGETVEPAGRVWGIGVSLRTDRPEALAAQVAAWRRDFDRLHFIRE